MTLFQKRKYYHRSVIVSIILCFSFVCPFFIIAIHQYIQSSICIPIKLNNQTFDDQEDWEYQNSITGQWFRWKILEKNQQWSVKWLNTVPTSSLGVIVYLTTRGELTSLNYSLAQLSRLLINNPRPVVIFHDGDLIDNNLQQSLAHTISSRFPIAFERIHFGNRSRILTKHWPVGYLHMCRFFILMLPNHPLLTLFSYYLRMDAHSYIFGPSPITDPFEIMQKRQIQYAYIMTNEDDNNYVANLWPFFHQFLRDHCLKPSIAVRQTQTNLFNGYSLAIIFTNFAIVNTSLFRDHSMIRNWLVKIDKNGGIYAHRWGDAPVHTLALTQFLSRNDIVRFRYFGYMHRSEYVCASGTKHKQCQEQVQPFRFNHHFKYMEYDDGCWPSKRNPLCHYYSEINVEDLI